MSYIWNIIILVIIHSFLILGNAASGDQQLVVSMEFNGVLYEGVLFANPASNANSTISSTQIQSSTATVNNNNSNSIERVPHSIVSS